MSKDLMTESAAAAQDDATSTSIGGLVKDALVLANAARLVLMTISAATKWSKHKDAMAGPAQKFLIFNAILVAIVTVYKFTSKMVRPLFFCQMLSHYSLFIIFTILWRYGDNEKLRAQRKHYGGQILKMHIAYWIVMAVGVALCTCTPTNIYPVSFVMGDALMVVSYFLINKLYKAGIARLPGEEPTELDNQVKVFMSKYRFMAIWHFIECVLGVVFF